MSDNRVPFSMPSINAADVEAVVATLRSGWLAFGEQKERFEAAFAKRIGVPHAVTTNSCTSALEITLKAAGVRGEVVVPSFTWTATANAVVNAGAKPVFCDVDLETGNVTAETIELALSSQTEAVIVVHYAGQPCEMDAIVALCRKRGLLLIEDSAETLGATWKGQSTGSFGIGCFSFYPTKAMTTGEGGMLTTGDRALADKARTLISHGVPSSPPLDGRVHAPWERAAVEAGHNYRMPNLLAALGLSQLQRLDELNARRVALAQRYDRAIEEHRLPLRKPLVRPGTKHVYQLYVVRCEAGRDSLLSRLWQDGIGANIHFEPPVHRQPLYLRLHSDRRYQLPRTEQLCSEVLSLPIFPDMTHQQQDWVIESVCRAISTTASSNAERRG